MFSPHISRLSPIFYKLCFYNLLTGLSLIFLSFFISPIEVFLTTVFLNLSFAKGSDFPFPLVFVSITKSSFFLDFYIFFLTSLYIFFSFFIYSTSYRTSSTTMFLRHLCLPLLVLRFLRRIFKLTVSFIF